VINITPEQRNALLARAPATPSYAMPGAASGYQRFDFRQRGAGLASEGYSIDRPDEAFNYFKRMQANPHNVNERNLLTNVQRYGAANPGSWDNPQYVTQALDWHFRNQQRNNQKTPGLGILGTLAPIAAGFIPGVGPALSAALSTGIGAATGGWKGALLGAASSVIGPSIKVPGGVGNALAHPIKAAASVAKQFANPATAARAVASKGVSSLGGRRG
jgi:hypothetical protein